MDLITGDIKKLYKEYLTASLVSAVVMSIYSFVDTIAVGQSAGPSGAAAMAVITPLWGVLVFLSILCGIGGSVLYANARGEGEPEKANALFTASALLMALLTVAAWVLFALFHERIFLFFGADAELMPRVMEYAVWLIRFLPVFIAPIFVSSFVRNDGAPGLAMASVIVGGGLNMFGDWFLVFPLGMGMTGAALATLIGTAVQVLILCGHFFSKKCTLRLVRPQRLLPAFRRILSIGFGAGMLDFGTVVLGILMNNRIMQYGTSVHLALYGVLATITSLFQALFCGVGQAVQPIASANCGAGRPDRIETVRKLALVTVLVMGVAFAAAGEIFPQAIARLFMDVTPEVLTAAPSAFRPYFLIFMPLGINVLSTYYLQSTLHDAASMLIAVLKGAAVSGLMILLLPMAFGLAGVWTALPVSELIVACIALAFMYGSRPKAGTPADGGSARS